jgi:anti-sigma-K factor RskA
MSITCEHADEMLASFAMNRLDREDEAAVSDHLSTCRQHDTDLVEMRMIAAALPLAVEEEEPPRRMRERLLKAFDEQTGAVPARRIGAPGRLDWLWRRPQWGYGLAAALLVAVIAVGAWGASRDDGGVSVKTFHDGGMSMRLVYLRDQKIAVVDLEMPVLASDKTYQAWKIDAAGSPVSLGIIGERGSFAFHADLSDARAIAISVEPSGGSSQPTTTPVLVEEL